MTETSEGLAQGRHRGKVRRRPVRKMLGWLGEALLTLLSIFGVVCVGAVIAAYVFGVNIMMFKTGSMSPGIPAGSVALVRDLDARAGIWEIRLGDYEISEHGYFGVGQAAAQIGTLENQ